MKYNLGVTRIQDETGEWKPLKGAWIKQDDGNWAPIKTGWVKKDDGTWERIYPTPAGVFSANVTTITSTPYDRHYDTPKVVKITNTGDYDLTINDITINDDVSVFATRQHTFPTLPAVIAPGANVKISSTIFGRTVGTSTNANISFVNDIGYLGYANTSIPVSVTVIPDFNGIGSNIATIANLWYYEFENSTNYSYTSPGTYSYTVPAGVTSLSVALAGAGGGGGGNDSHGGSSGYPGHALSGELSVTTGDVIDIYVGGGGTQGYSGSGYGAGTGGSSTVGYNGGNGSAPGPAGWSGGGGGGGAATVVKKNGSIIAVAAGGGGGGGGGNHSYGQGQQGAASSGTTYGSAGQSRGGDGGGAGGGGGGQLGGAGGGLLGGDNGGYAGSDGSDFIPSGFSLSYTRNTGAPNVAGSNGYASLVEHGQVLSATQAITVINTGNGADLNISSVTSQNGFLQIATNPASTIGYDFDNFQGNTSQFTVVPYTKALGTYKDTIIINSDALNAPVYKIPVTINVIRPNGHASFTNEGVYNWVVPPHVHRINLLTVGSGGGGGGGLSNGFVSQGGGGGGGGSGGYRYDTEVSVIPGETLTIRVGTPGGSGERNSKLYYPVSLSYAWSSFMNSYAVWTSSDQVSPVGVYVSSGRVLTIVETGTYTITTQADNHVQVYVDDTLVVTSNSFTSSSTGSIYLTQGNHSIRFLALNDGGPAGFAAIVQDPSTNIVWNTRTLLDPNSGTTGGATTVTGSFGTISVDGGAAGGGGYNDYVAYDPGPSGDSGGGGMSGGGDAGGGDGGAGGD